MNSEVSEFLTRFHKEMIDPEGKPQRTFHFMVRGDDDFITKRCQDLSNLANKYFANGVWSYPMGEFKIHMIIAIPLKYVEQFLSEEQALGEKNKSENKNTT